MRRLHGLPCSTVSAEGASHDEPWEFAARPTPAIEDAHHPADISRRLRLARRIWDAASNARGTPVENYLAGRGIALPAPPSLRWAEHCWHDAIALSYRRWSAGSVMSMARSLGCTVPI